jgi:DegV family protein with EDD domain
MSHVVIITDSTASLPEEMYEAAQIAMVPYYIHLKGHALRDMLDIKPAEFCEYLADLPEEAELPKTANPGPGDYLSAFISAAERGKDIISFHMTSRGSGAYQAALVGKEMALERLQGVRIRVVDTMNVSMCHGWMALQAARAALQGASLEDIMQLVARMIPRARMIQTADTLRYLYMGGRIGRAGHLVGSLLRIRPLISMKDGLIVALGMARSREGAYRRMASLLKKDVGSGGRVRLALTHAMAMGDAEKLAQLVREVVRPVEVLFCPMCPALTVHTGPGTVGLCYVPEEVSHP